LRNLAEALRLRGARTVVAGIQPDVAFAMVQLGLTLDGILTALDLDEGLELLTARQAEDDDDSVE
jgi:rsbT antagonist protein RsbS